MQKKVKEKKPGRKKDKSIELLFILDESNPYLDEDKLILNILSVVATQEEAEEYIDKRLFTINFEHFKSWCELRNLAIGKDSWLQYKLLVYNPYYYEKTKVDYHSIASLMRMFYGCTPIGCSYDTIIETSALLDRLDNIRDSEEEEDLTKYQA